MKTISIIGASIGIASPMQGASLGPEAIRMAGLREKLRRLGKKVEDAGNLPSLEEPFPPKHFRKAAIRYPDEAREFLSLLKEKVLAALEQRHLPLVLGGDHSIAMASLSAAAGYYASIEKKPGLIWFDAHADLNTGETSPTGNIHGMPLAVALGKGDERLISLFEGRFFDPKRTAIIGVRSVDPLERDLVRELGVTVFTMKDIDDKGMTHCVRKALETASPDGNPYHLSFDVDVIDSQFAPGTATPVLGGVTLREAHLFMEMIAENGNAWSIDVAEVNPLLDHENRTSEVAVLLLESVFGKVIY
ncbi:MAG: arginase [Nitrospinae bacterium]|nr:arginase [Nitrospinota bacterium]